MTFERYQSFAFKNCAQVFHTLIPSNRSRPSTFV
jgi:hypothetical protein